MARMSKCCDPPRLPDQQSTEMRGRSGSYRGAFLLSLAHDEHRQGSRMNRRLDLPRELIGFAVAPLPASILAMLVMIGLGQTNDSVYVAFLTLLFLYADQVMFGIAIRIELQKKNLSSLTSFSIAGIAMVLILKLPIILIDAAVNSRFLVNMITLLALSTLYGCLCGATYWILTRPDRAVDGLVSTFS